MAEDLYALPLEEFTSARNRLARDLAQAGDRDEASRVKALRKPSQPAWVVNQLVRREKKEAKALLRAGERLQKAQEKALGGGGRSGLEGAVDAEREAVERLVASAGRIAEETGLKLNEANVGRVRSTLHAVSLDEEVRERFAAGELVEDGEATGVDMLALMATAPQRPGAGKAKKTGEPGAAKKRLRAAQAEERRIEGELEEARRELNAATERVKQLEGRLIRARKATARASGA